MKGFERLNMIGYTGVNLKKKDTFPHFHILFNCYPELISNAIVMKLSMCVFWPGYSSWMQH